MRTIVGKETQYYFGILQGQCDVILDWMIQKVMAKGAGSSVMAMGREASCLDRVRPMPRSSLVRRWAG